MELFWSLGIASLGVLGYFVRDWRTLQLVLIFPSVIAMVLFCWVPESPIWYLTKNRPDLALKEMEMIARRNGEKLIIPNNLIVTVKPPKVKVKVEVEEKQNGSLLNVITNRVLLKHLTVMIITYFTLNWAYYALLLNIPSLSGGKIFLSMARLIEIFHIPQTDTSISSSVH